MTHHIGLVLSEASYVVEIHRSGLVQGKTAVAYSSPYSSTLTSTKNAKDETIVGKPKYDSTNQEERVAAKFVQDEKREQDRVSLKVYAAYIVAAGGYIAWVFIFLSFFFVTALTLGRSYWVELWAKAAEPTKATFSRKAKTYLNFTENSSIHVSRQDETVFFLLVYLGLSILIVVLTGVKVGATMVASLRASKALFQELTSSVLRAKVRWLDTTPIGRILNRFVGDFEKVNPRAIEDPYK